MKSLYRMLFATVVVALVGGIAVPTTVIADNHKGMDKKGWYSEIVDGAFVEENATLPRKEGVTVIDSRPAARKYDSGHIPGAISIPDREFDKMVDALPKDKSSLLIFYCGGMKCKLSHKSAFKAEKLGYTNVKVYAAGYPDWVKRGNLQGVSVAHVKKLLDKGKKIVVVDSRPERKFKKGAIPGAISIPDRGFEKMVDKLPADKATPLYFYCGGYKCKLSPNSARKAIKAGYTEVFVVPAGYPAWKKAYDGAVKAMPKIESGEEGGTITIASFNQIMKQSPEEMLVVDVRDPEEFSGGTIKGAINVPIDELEKKMDSLPKDKAIVFVCGTGGRAGEAYDMVQMFKPELKSYFLNAEITFHKDGSYQLKDIM